ncbi:MAG: PspA/IM30 family protein [Acidobacteriota bacterium]
MAITNRIRRLFHADVNAVLDIIEEPEAILKQAIREMQEALDLKRPRLARDQKHLS